MAIGTGLSNLFQTAGQNQAKTGTGYTNLNKFLNANQGNQLGQKVAGNLQTQVGGVQSQLGQQKTEFEKEAEKNRLDTDANKQSRDAVIGRFSSASSAGGDLDKEDVNKFSQFRAGQYAGPKGLQDTSTLSNQAQQLAGQTSNLSPSGTQELLRRTVGDGRYTQGQQRLDSLLLDRSGIKQVGRQAQALGSDINRANLAAQGQAQALTGQAQQFGADTTAALKNSLAGLDTEAANQLTAAQAAETNRQAQLEALQRTLSGNQIAKLDANGNPVLDANGKQVYETKLTGTTDPYARVDEISKQLKDSGLVNQNQFEALFGKGTFGENKSAYDTNLNKIGQQEVLNSLAGGGNYLGLGNQLYNASQNRHNTEEFSTGLNGILNKVGNYIAANKLDDSAGAYNTALSELYKSGQLSEAEINDATARNSYRNIANKSDPGVNINYQKGTDQAARNAAMEAFKSATGLAGRSTLDNRSSDFYNTLAQSLGANSTNAQGLTKEAVAAAPIRANYASLASLLGTPDVNPYSGESTYKAGTNTLDAEQIKRALGY